MPIYDGKLLTKDTFKMNNIPSLPKIIGITQNDMFPIILKQICKKWVKCDKNSKCFLYCFARDLPGDKNGSWHSSDLLYAFSTLDKNWRPFEDIDYTISNQIATLYRNGKAAAKK